MCGEGLRLAECGEGLRLAECGEGLRLAVCLSGEYAAHVGYMYLCPTVEMQLNYDLMFKSSDCELPKTPQLLSLHYNSQ